jgi:hypothetical protein
VGERIHFLHIGKTGGNAVKYALRCCPQAALEIVLHPHQTTLAHIPEGERVLFMLRDPVDRFVSGFNSRRRRGRPLNNVEWDAQEAPAFDAFATPDMLASSLSSADEAERARAVAAMKGIRHVKSYYADWLGDLDYVCARQKDIVWVGLTSRLSTDFERLRRRLNLPEACQLPADPVAAHRRLSSDPTELSLVAVNNIRVWYAADYPFLDHFFPEWG